MNIYYIKQYKLGLIEMYFEGVPGVAIRKSMKNNFWRWNPEKECWCNKINSQVEAFAKALGAIDKTNEKKYDYNQKTNTTKLKKDLETLGCRETNPKKIQEFLRNLDGPSFDSYPESAIASCFNMMCRMVGWFGVIAEDTYGNSVMICIVTNADNQNTEKNIYWIERSVSKAILHGIVNNKPYFIFKDKVYCIKYYTDTDFIRKIKRHQDYFTNQSDIPEIWIYSMKMPCHSHPNSLELVNAYVKVDSVSYLCRLTVYYCSVCDKYYINSEQYSAFAKKYGLPFVRLRTEKRGGNVDFSEWKEESMLHTMGYNVNMNENLSDDERREKLVHAMKTGSLEDYEIISFLEFLIYRNEGKYNFENACDKWRSDIEFVRNYNVNGRKNVLARFKDS